jgi:hypothetical protein
LIKTYFEREQSRFNVGNRRFHKPMDLPNEILHEWSVILIYIFTYESKEEDSIKTVP